MEKTQDLAVARRKGVSLFRLPDPRQTLWFLLSNRSLGYLVFPGRSSLNLGLHFSVVERTADYNIPPPAPPAAS